MPNPMKNVFRRPSLRKVKKIASRQYRKLIPERGSYDVAKYRALTGVAPDWLIKQVQFEDAIYKHGFDKPRVVRRRHSFEYPQIGPQPRPYHSYEGRLPAYEEAAMAGTCYDDSSMGMSNLSQLVEPASSGWSPPSFYGGGGGMVCSSPVMPSNDESSISMANLSQCLDYDRSYGPSPQQKSADSSSLRELMFMLDQLEAAEIEKIQKDLRLYQTWRRRLMFDVASLSSTAAPPAALMKPSREGGPSGQPAIGPP